MSVVPSLLSREATTNQLAQSSVSQVSPEYVNYLRHVGGHFDVYITGQKGSEIGLICIYGILRHG